MWARNTSRLVLLILADRTQTHWLPRNVMEDQNYKHLLVAGVLLVLDYQWQCTTGVLGTSITSGQRQHIHSIRLALNVSSFSLKGIMYLLSALLSWVSQNLLNTLFKVKLFHSPFIHTPEGIKVTFPNLTCVILFHEVKSKVASLLGFS